MKDDRGPGTWSKVAEGCGKAIGDGIQEDRDGCRNDGPGGQLDVSGPEVGVGCLEDHLKIDTSQTGGETGSDYGNEAFEGLESMIHVLALLHAHRDSDAGEGRRGRRNDAVVSARPSIVVVVRGERRKTLGRRSAMCVKGRRGRGWRKVGDRPCRDVAVAVRLNLEGYQARHALALELDDGHSKGEHCEREPLPEAEALAEE